jgi:hypothetical protein
MCTLSIIARPDGGFRGVCNRDESRDRAIALPPESRTLASDGRSVRAIWPTDPAGGGTWIAANSAGVLLCLLNYNPSPAVGPTAASPAARGLVSRGLIIPELAKHTSAAAALKAAGQMDLSDFAPFRLVVVEAAAAGPTATELRWDRRMLTTLSHEPGPVCFASSGLGDERVQGRLGLFAQLVTGVPTAASQDRFHAHRWSDRPELSVMMSREDARTVSVTAVDVARAEGGYDVSMQYHPTADERSRSRLGAAAQYRSPEG